MLSKEEMREGNGKYDLSVSFCPFFVDKTSGCVKSLWRRFSLGFLYLSIYVSIVCVVSSFSYVAFIFLSVYLSILCIFSFFLQSIFFLYLFIYLFFVLFLALCLLSYVAFIYLSIYHLFALTLFSLCLFSIYFFALFLFIISSSICSLPYLYSISLHLSILYIISIFPRGIKKNISIYLSIYFISTLSLERKVFLRSFSLYEIKLAINIEIEKRENIDLLLIVN